MTKLGWTILAIFVLAIAGFVSVLSIGPGEVASVARQPIPAAAGPAMVVPVRGIPPNAIVPSWGDPRGGGSRSHQGTDIAAPPRTPVVAAAAGTVEKLFQSDAGGTTLYVRSPDRRVSYYYAHLAGYAPGVREGQAVRPGDPLGYVGDTGNAGAGNYHLHFGMSRMRATDRWWQGEPVDPAPLLARAGVAR